MTRRNINGTRHLAGAVLLLIALSSTSDPLNAQAVERTDTPRAGEVRVTFEPRIDAWDQAFTSDGSVQPLGAPLSGDTIGPRQIPGFARLEQDVRTASGLSTFVPSLGAGTLTLYHEKRVTPLQVELGVTSRLSISVYAPLVRIAPRAAFTLSAATANLGANPLATTSGAVQRYASFFGQFNAVLGQLQDSITTGHYGCPSSPACTQANSLLATGAAVRDALQRTIYGSASLQSAFVPLAGSPAGQKIDSSLAALQQLFSGIYHIAGFSDSLLLPTDTLTAPANFDAFLGEVVGANDSIFGFGYNPFRSYWRYGLGNVEVETKYRLNPSPHWALALAVVARLPTATRDTALEVLGIPMADLQPGVEGRVIQELIVARRLWLNVAVRGGIQLPGTAARRVAPFEMLLAPFQTTTTLDWTAGNYAAVDVAPMYRFTPRFALGFTAGFWTKAADSYSYHTLDDSVAIANKLGIGIPASVVATGTAEQWLRVGVALTYIGPSVEGGFTVEQTVSGSGNFVPAAMVYRLRFRISEKLF